MPFSKHSGCTWKVSEGCLLYILSLFYSDISWLQTGGHWNSSDINWGGDLSHRPTMQPLKLSAHGCFMSYQKHSHSIRGSVTAHRPPAPFENRNHIPTSDQSCLICRGNYYWWRVIPRPAQGPSWKAAGSACKDEVSDKIFTSTELIFAIPALSRTGARLVYWRNSG